MGTLIVSVTQKRAVLWVFVLIFKMEIESELQDSEGVMGVKTHKLLCFWCHLLSEKFIMTYVLVWQPTMI